MFSDTLTITINAVAKVLTRINQDGYSSEYMLKDSTECYRLRLRNTSYIDKTRAGKLVNRHNIELIHEIFPVAPAIYSTLRKTYTVFENDDGDNVTNVAKEVTGLLAFQTEANTTKLINWES